MTWTNPATLGVTSITGTANQITASASTGAVTLSFPATGGISIGSYQATTPPTGGLIAPGQSSFGSNAPGTTNFFTVNPTTTTNWTSGLVLSGSVLGTATIVSTGEQAGILLNATLKPTGTATKSVDVYIVPTVDASVATSTTIANTYGLYVTGGSLASGTVTNSYGGYFTNPAFGTTKVALYADNILSPLYGVQGSSSGIVTIQSQTGTYNFNLPTTAGTAGYFLTSQGGGSTSMTWTNPATLGVTSITGTANQIVASASTGAVTLSRCNHCDHHIHLSSRSPSHRL